MIVRPWQPGDTQRIDLQAAQEYMHGFMEMSADLSHLSDAGLAWTWEADDEVLGIAGLLPQWENRALAWALIGKSAGKHFHAIHKSVKRMLDVTEFRRIEANVDVGFAEGIRWMRLLGFAYEGYMTAYRPDGADMLLFARVR